jgi:CcmD family protein
MRLTVRILALSSLFVAFPVLLAAQSALPEAGSLGAQNLRGYTHMFIAYFIAWAVILGWIVSIARRLGRVQKAMED